MQAHSRTQTGPKERREQGFTLVELLMAMLVSTVIMGAMYCAFHAQHRTQNAQEQVADMELNARLAMSMMAEDIRMAGFDPDGNLTKKILRATPGEFQFETHELEDKKWVKRTITYCIPKTIAGNECDPDRDGVVNADWTDWVENRPYLGRVASDNNQPQPLARGVEAVEFVYLVGDDMTPTLRPADDKLDDIRAVTVTLLMRGVTGDRTISPREITPPGSAHIHGMSAALNRAWSNLPGSDAHGPLRRRVHYSTVQLRNLNLIKP